MIENFAIEEAKICHKMVKHELLKKYPKMILGFRQTFDGCDECEVLREELRCPGPKEFVVLANGHGVKPCEITYLRLLPLALVIGGLAHHVDGSQCHTDIGIAL